MATIFSLINKLIRWIGFKNVATFTLLSVCLGSLVFGLDLPVFEHKAWTIALICLCGLLFGWFLEGHIQRGWAAGALTLGLGCMSVLLVIGRLWQPISALFSIPVEWLNQVRSLDALSIETITEIGDLGLNQAWSYFLLALATLLSRSWLRLVALIQIQISYDPLADLVVWSFIVILLSVWAVWWVRRRSQVPIALLPTGAILAVNLATSPAPIYPLLVWLAAALILYALVNYLDHGTKWQKLRIDSADIQLEWALVVGMLTMASVSSALIIPSFSLEKITGRVRLLNPSGSAGETTTGETSQTSRIIKTTSALQGLEVFQVLPNEHLLGSGPELREQVIMWVSLADDTSLPNEAIESKSNSAPPTYYWRGLVYDRYLGYGWTRTSREMVEIPAGESLEPDLYALHHMYDSLVNQHVQFTSSEGGVLFTAGEPITATVPVTANMSNIGETFGALTEFGEYTAASSVPLISTEQLRNAGETYPDWILDRYLTLPDKLPTRTRELAADLIAVQPTPFDRALAIEGFLRTIPYTLDIPPPPPVSDLVDYYLFDLQRGFCDYSASAMVVLARAAGTPARLVVGYTAGEYIPDESRFEVSAADAHAWPELYFPNFGWVAFEPTGGRPPINRITAESDNQAALEPSAALFPNIRWEFNIQMVVTISLISITLSAIFVFGLILFDTWWLKRQSPTRAAYLVYRRLQIVGKRKLAKLLPGTTPNEYVEDLGQQLVKALSVEHLPLADYLTIRLRKIGAVYSRSIYSAHETGDADKSEIIRIWTGLRIKLVRFLLRSN